MRLTQKLSQWGSEAARLGSDQTDGPREGTKVLPSWAFNGENSRAVAWLASEDPGINRFTITQCEICKTVDTFEFPNAIYRAPLHTRKEIGRANHIHEGPVANTEYTTGGLTVTWQ